MLTSLDFGMVGCYAVANETMWRPQSVEKMHARLWKAGKNPRCRIKRRRAGAYYSQKEWPWHEAVDFVTLYLRLMTNHGQPPRQHSGVWY